MPSESLKRLEKLLIACEASSKELDKEEKDWVDECARQLHQAKNLEQCREFCTLIFATMQCLVDTRRAGYALFSQLAQILQDFRVLHKPIFDLMGSFWSPQSTSNNENASAAEASAETEVEENPYDAENFELHRPGF